MYLDVRFNLSEGLYQPHQKPNEEIHYIHVQSDYPQSEQTTPTVHWKMVINTIIIKIYILRDYQHHIMSNVSSTVDTVKKTNASAVRRQ